MTISSQMLAVHDAAKAISDNIAEFETITDGELIESLDAALANLEPELKELRAQGGVRVKGLEWDATGSRDWVADSVVGQYVLNRDELSAGGCYNLWVPSADDDDFAIFTDKTDAKAAAEADYRTRILSALETEAVAECATEGCERPATNRFEAGGVGSTYCGECFAKVIEIVAPPRSSIPTVTGDAETLRSALADLVSWFDGGPSRWGPWIIEAGELGADGAVEAARTALSSESKP